MGGRILKTAVAVTIAVFIAHSLGYDQVTLAAIVALFTVQRTFYHSLQQSLGKVGSVFIGAIIGTVFAVLIGENAFTFGLITLVVILTCLKLNLQSQIPITLVTAVFMISSQAEGLQVYIILDQILLALIGSISALGVNYFFTPDHQEELQSKVENIERELELMLEDLLKKIPCPNKKSDLEIFTKLYDLKKEAREGLELSKLFREEQKFNFTGDTLADIYREQFRALKYFIDSIEEMYRLSERMGEAVPQSIEIAKLIRLLKKMQKNALYGRKIPYKFVDKIFKNLEDQYEEMELPKNRGEFKSRASLFHIFNEIKKYYKRIKEFPPVPTKKV